MADEEAAAQVVDDIAEQQSESFGHTFILRNLDSSEMLPGNSRRRKAPSKNIVGAKNSSSPDRQWHGPSLPAVGCRNRLVQAELLVQRDHGALHGGRSTTSEMLYSEEPWAMAMMLIAFAAERGEGAPGDAGDAVHVFADHGDDRHVGIGGDVLDGLLGDFRREGVAQRLDRALFSAVGITKQISFCDDDCETSSTLARSAAVAANDRASTSVQAHDAGPAHGDHGDVANGRERLHAAAIGFAARR